MSETFTHSENLNKIMELLAQDLDERTDLYLQADGTYAPGINVFLSPEQKFVSIQLAGFAKAINDLGMALSESDGDKLAGVVGPVLTRISHLEFSDKANMDRMDELISFSQDLENQFKEVGLKFPHKYWEELRGG